MHWSMNTASLPRFVRLILSRLLLLAVALFCVCQSGCVRRRMTIRSNPPGARVYIDDQDIGTTPVSTSFTYYGTRKIKLVRNGYETLTVLQPFKTPWYQIPPLDFASENLWPREIRDEREVTFQLQPQVAVPTNELMQRAEELRHGMRQGRGPIPLPPTSPHGPPRTIPTGRNTTAQELPSY